MRLFLYRAKALLLMQGVTEEFDDAELSAHRCAR